LDNPKVYCRGVQTAARISLIITSNILTLTGAHTLSHLTVIDYCSNFLGLGLGLGLGLRLGGLTLTLTLTLNLTLTLLGAIVCEPHFNPSS